MSGNLSPCPRPDDNMKKMYTQPHDNVCEWVSGNWTFPQLQVQAPTSLLVSTNCRSCQRTCSRSLKANVGENVKPFSFLLTQCSQFWLSTLPNLYIARPSCYFKTNMVLWDETFVTKVAFQWQKSFQPENCHWYKDQRVGFLAGISSWTAPACQPARTET